MKDSKGNTFNICDKLRATGTKPLIRCISVNNNIAKFEWISSGLEPFLLQQSALDASKWIVCGGPCSIPYHNNEIILTQEGSYNATNK